METVFDIVSAGHARGEAILAPGRTPLLYADLRETVLRLAGQLRSVGRSTGIEIAIMNDSGTLAGRGERGEVVIKGPTVISEYENNPEANSKSFTDGWFRTGDQGYLDTDGYLFLTGRLKDHQPRRRKGKPSRGGRAPALASSHRAGGNIRTASSEAWRGGRCGNRSEIRQCSDRARDPRLCRRAIGSIQGPTQDRPAGRPAQGTDGKAATDWTGATAGPSLEGTAGGSNRYWHNHHGTTILSAGSSS